jgi:hypothetical protein
MDGHVRLGGLQQGHDGRGAAEEVEPTVVGGNIVDEGGTGDGGGCAIRRSLGKTCQPIVGT